jgi:hypothetical protein
MHNSAMHVFFLIIGSYMFGAVTIFREFTPKFPLNTAINGCAITRLKLFIVPKHVAAK